jgi:hypothetical protein
MHKLIILFILIISYSFHAQVPELFKYQSVARNSTGQTLVNSPVGIRLSIVEGSVSGTVVYTEEHNVITNDFGLFNLNVGGGTASLGNFATIDWGASTKFLQIEADFSGGTTYTDMGTSQLLSVPYALYAKYSGVPLLPNGENAGNTVYWDGSNWITNSSNIYNNGGFIGIGTSAPVQKLDIIGQVNIPTDSAYMINNRPALSTKGVANLLLGFNAGTQNGLGMHNVFAGFNSGMVNNVGSQNTFVGSETGVSNLDGMLNTFMGRRAGFSNISGTENTYIGCYAGQSTTNGFHNSFFGVTTGNSTTTGEENTFMGAHAGYYNTTGSNNTFLGNFAGQFNTVGNNNIFIGFNADGASSLLNNAIAIGAGSVVSASNSVVIGNAAVTSIGGQVGWSTLSDGRYKKNIQKENLGLDFILKLRPVRYEYIFEEQAEILYSGLIAQEIDELLTNTGQTFSGLVKPQTEEDKYSIRYAEFVIPMINAIQEQQQQIEKLKEENNALQHTIEQMQALEERIKLLEMKK